jgi:hypothetical protein
MVMNEKVAQIFDGYFPLAFLPVTLFLVSINILEVTVLVVAWLQV